MREEVIHTLVKDAEGKHDLITTEVVAEIIAKVLQLTAIDCSTVILISY